MGQSSMMAQSGPRFRALTLQAMSDRDDLGQAWRVAPSRYLEQRRATHAVGVPGSCYVTMRDGVRLAVDVYLPEGAERPERLPAIAVFTPYYRRFKVAAPGAEPSPNVAIYRDFFVARGYAVVAVDVRGCGASFGARDCFRSPREREDHREIADWIVAQAWSSGVIGSTGISYLGAAACFLASTGHPAVKAIAPLFAVHDTYSDHVFPGGIKCTTVTENYDELVRALDLDLRDKLAPYPYFNDLRYAGPAPVDEDPEGKLLADALEQHRDSFRMRDLAPEFAFREEAASHDPEMHSGAFSPYWYLGQVPGQVNTYSVSGWYDGSAFANGAIARFLSNPGADNRLLLGPWDHGARTKRRSTSTRCARKSGKPPTPGRRMMRANGSIWRKRDGSSRRRRAPLRWRHTRSASRPVPGTTVGSSGLARWPSWTTTRTGTAARMACSASRPRRSSDRRSSPGTP